MFALSSPFGCFHQKETDFVCLSSLNCISPRILNHSVNLQQPRSHRTCFCPSRQKGRSHLPKPCLALVYLTLLLHFFSSPSSFLFLVEARTKLFPILLHHLVRVLFLHFSFFLLLLFFLLFFHLPSFFFSWIRHLSSLWHLPWKVLVSFPWLFPSKVLGSLLWLFLFSFSSLRRTLSSHFHSQVSQESILFHRTSTLGIGWIKVFFVHFLRLKFWLLHLRHASPEHEEDQAPYCSLECLHGTRLALVTPTADWFCLALVHFHCSFFLLLFLASTPEMPFLHVICSQGDKMLPCLLHEAIACLRCIATSSFFSCLQSLKFSFDFRICHSVLIDFVRQQTKALLFPIDVLLIFRIFSWAAVLSFCRFLVLCWMLCISCDLLCTLWRSGMRSCLLCSTSCNYCLSWTSFRYPFLTRSLSRARAARTTPAQEKDSRRDRDSSCVNKHREFEWKWLEPKWLRGASKSCVTKVLSPPFAFECRQARIVTTARSDLSTQRGWAGMLRAPAQHKKLSFSQCSMYVCPFWSAAVHNLKGTTCTRRTLRSTWRRRGLRFVRHRPPPPSHTTNAEQKGKGTQAHKNAIVAASHDADHCQRKSHQMYHRMYNGPLS